MSRKGSTFQSFLEDERISEEVNAEAKKLVKEFKKSLVHWLPPYRRDTYCGLNPTEERAKGNTIKTTVIRPSITCPDCKGLPVEESVK